MSAGLCLPEPTRPQPPVSAPTPEFSEQPLSYSDNLCSEKPRGGGLGMRGVGGQGWIWVTSRTAPLSAEVVMAA